MTTRWSRSSTEQKKKKTLAGSNYFYIEESILYTNFCACLTLSDCNWTRTQNHLAWKQTLNHLAKLAIFIFFLMIELCSEYLSVWCIWLYHVTYAFQNESPFYSCLNVKELLAWSRSKIWSLSNCNCTRTQNHLVCKRTLNHLAKLAILFFLMIELCSEYLSVQCILLYILVMSHTRSRVNPHFIVAWMSRNSLLEAGMKFEV